MADPQENVSETPGPSFFAIPSGFVYRSMREFSEEQRDADPAGYDRDLSRLSEQIAEVDRYHSPAAMAARLAILDQEVRW